MRRLLLTLSLLVIALAVRAENDPAAEPPAATAGASVLDLRITFFNPLTQAPTDTFPRGTDVGYRVVGLVPDTVNKHLVDFDLVATIRTGGFAFPIPLTGLIKDIPVLDPQSNQPITFDDRY